MNGIVNNYLFIFKPRTVIRLNRRHFVDELKQRLVDVWSGLQQSRVDTAISEWRKRLQACVRTKGGYFEHLW